MKHSKILFAFLLALLIAAFSPLQVLAAGQVSYISEIRLGYGDEGKEALEAEGFTVWTNLNANEGGSSAVWLGYTTTDKAEEAITDVALMNMKGGYSFDAYTEEVANLNRQVSEQLNNFAAAIEEFRTNYAAGSPYAEQALELMNGFYDDDSKNADGSYKGVGDILLDESTTEDTLHMIFLEGNSEAITVVEEALAIACIETDDENVLTRLAEADYPDELSTDLAAARTNLNNAFSDFHSSALALQQLYDEASSYEGGIEGFLNRDTLTEEESFTYTMQLTRYILLVATDFGTTGMSLLDFALLDPVIPNDDGEVLEDEYLEMLAQSMTAGQLGLVANVGILTILCNASAGLDTESAESGYQNLSANLGNQETVSVYYGVDRDLFTDTDGVALTSAAIREMKSAETSEFGRDSNADKSKAILFTSLASAALAAGVVATAVGLRMVTTTCLDVVGDLSANAVLEEGIVDMAAEGGELAVEIGEAGAGAAGASGVSVAGVITTAVGVVAIIAAVVLAIFAILAWLEKPETVRVEYTQIPRAIVERPTGERNFITYYAAKLAGAADDETDSLKCFGDLNALNGTSEWVALYYTKNTTMGSPITTELLVNSSSTLNVSNDTYYTPIHMFGSKTAANLNQYNTEKGAEDVYVFFRNTGTSSQAGSVFTTGTVLTGVAALFIGAGIAGAVTYTLMRKKKTVPLSAECDN